MYAHVELTYEARQLINKMTDDEFSEVRELFPMFDFPEVGKQAGYWSNRDALIDLSIMGEELLRRNLKFDIKRFKSCYKVATPDRTVNIQVAIPNFALFMIDEVQLMEDCCTNALQAELDDGWRILAVCPPTSQRRPDYILGRTKSIV